MQRLAVRLCRLVCLLQREDQGGEVLAALSVPVPWGRKDQVLPTPLDSVLPGICQGIWGGDSQAQDMAPPHLGIRRATPGLCSSCAHDATAGQGPPGPRGLSVPSAKPCPHRPALSARDRVVIEVTGLPLPHRDRLTFET